MQINDFNVEGRKCNMDNWGKTFINRSLLFSKTTELKKDKTDNKQANRELRTALRNSKSLTDQAMPEVFFFRVFEKLLANINDGDKEKETK